MIEGDVQTDLDAQRVARYGVPVVQIVTNGGCHLEAQLVREALDQLDLGALDLLVIENVGNLVCPANYDLGEALKVVVLSTTEGDDKPLKYPAMFRNAAVLVINKIDLLPYVPCDIEATEAERPADQSRPADLRDLVHHRRRHRRVVRLVFAAGRGGPCVNGCGSSFVARCRASASGPSSTGWPRTWASTAG